jgi:hypothetical protein
VAGRKRDQGRKFGAEITPFTLCSSSASSQQEIEQSQTTSSLEGCFIHSFISYTDNHSHNDLPLCVVSAIWFSSCYSSLSLAASLLAHILHPFTIVWYMQHRDVTHTWLEKSDIFR